MNDLKFAFRQLIRNPGFAAVAILTLALGIGVNCAIFSVVRAVLLRPLANRDEDRLLYLRQSAPGLGVENATFSIPASTASRRASSMNRGEASVPSAKPPCPTSSASC